MIVHAARLRAQGLSGPPATTPDAVVERLLAVQAQDPRGMRLAVRPRSTGLTAADVDAALADRRLVVDWLNRGTLHLVRAEDHGWLHALTTPQLATGNARRLRQEGVSPGQAERGVEAVRRAVRDGPQTRDALRERLLSADVPVAGQALAHVLLLASLRGHVLRGPAVAGQQAFVDARSWLGPQPVVDVDAALARLGRRYLVGHGPAGPADLARWAGIRLTDARRAFALAGDRLVERDGLLDVAGREDPPPLPPPRLLGPFDPLLLGWTSREGVVGPHRGLVTDNGLFRPFALVQGRAVGTWRYAGGRVELTPLEVLDDAVLTALEDDAGAVERFLPV